MSNAERLKRALTLLDESDLIALVVSIDDVAKSESWWCVTAHLAEIPQNERTRACLAELAQ